MKRWKIKAFSMRERERERERERGIKGAFGPKLKLTLAATFFLTLQRPEKDREWPCTVWFEWCKGRTLLDSQNETLSLSFFLRLRKKINKNKNKRVGLVYKEGKTKRWSRMAKEEVKIFGNNRF